MSNYQTARTATFKGLNRAPYISDGEMRSMKNLSSDAFPFLTTRKGRKPYTFTTYIPSPEGEAYQDIDRLPAPCAEELGKVYKVTKTPETDEYTSGKFYYYDMANETWTEGIKDSTFLGEEDTVLTHEGTQTLVSTNYHNSFSGENSLKYFDRSGSQSYLEKYGCTITRIAGTCSYYITRDRVRYIGEDNGIFKKGRYYAYNVYMEAYLTTTTATKRYDMDTLVEPNLEDANNGTVYRYYNIDVQTRTTTYKYIEPSGEERTETFSIEHNERFRSYLRGYGYWQEIEADEYNVVDGMPENPEDGKQVLFWKRYYGSPLENTYYVCNFTMNDAGEKLYFYRKETSATTYRELTFLPEATEENLGTIYYYKGLATAGEFAKCRSDGNGEYVWEKIEHPNVPRVVTLKDYLDNYDGCGMTKLLEIGALNGRLTALFRDGENMAKLYHNRKLYDGIKSLSEESGKKLAVVGNRLIVGESGSYLHEKDGTVTFFSSAGTFSYSVLMVRKGYKSAALSGEYEYPTAQGRASTGKAVFELWSDINLEKNYVPEENLKELAEALSVAGTGFCVYGGRDISSVKQYLKVESVTFEPKRLMGGSSVGNEYADRLYIVASGVKEDFDWYEEGKKDVLTFESTDPHYYDVAAWKKRLWAYDKNVLHGTVADIFNDDGVVDWITGDNTYTESISQPIWQGGNITGIATLREALVLFKEDSLTLVTGNYPAIMSSSTIACHGLSAENRRSVAVANESVYYLSYDGVYRFSGGIPECISRDAKITGTDAVGASNGNKYYLSLLEDDGKYALYVYDIPLGLWHKEDDMRVISFVMIDGDMYGATETEIYNLNAQRSAEEWEAEFWYDEGTHRKKKYNGFHIRGKAGLSEVQIKADDGEWQAIHWSEDKLDFKFPPIECEELSIKIKGKGIWEIKSLDRDFEVI